MKRQNMKYGMGLLLGAAMALSGCVGEPTIQRGDDAETMLGTLNKVDNSQFGAAFVDPDIDYSEFTSVLVNPLNLDSVKIVQPSSTGSLDRIPSDWELTDKDRESLMAAFNEIMKDEIRRHGGFRVAEGPGPGVVVLEAMVTEIAPTAPKDDSSSMRGARSRVYTESAGTMSVMMAMGDSESGEILAVIKDTRGANANYWGMNNRAANMGEVRRHMRFWGSRLVEGLATMRTLSSMPTDPE